MFAVIGPSVMVHHIQLRFRLALVGLIIAVACGALAWFTGDARLWFFGLAVVVVLLPLLATGLIVLLHRVGLIDDEAAGRLGCLHGLGLLMLPVLLLMTAVPDNPFVLFAIPAAIVGLFGADVLVAIAFRLGLTKRRSLSSQMPGSRSVPRPSVLTDPSRAAAGFVVGAHLRLLRGIEREHYGPGQAVGRLLLIVTLPLFMLAVCGVIIAIGGYDGTALIVVGLIGVALCLAVGYLLSTSGDGR